MLELKEMHTYYGPSHVLHGIDLSLAEGEAVSVMGRNGAGKTTLMRTIMGLTPARSGQVLFTGSVDYPTSASRDFCHGNRLVPRGRRVFAKAHGGRKPSPGHVGTRVPDPAGRLQKAYERFPILGERKSQRVRGLSGGERQMLAIARPCQGDPASANG